MEKNIKIILSVLFLLCLAEMPFGFYELVRYLALLGFVYLAVMANKKGDEKEFYIFIALAVLFQPIFKISLGRTLWNLVDIVTAGWLLYSVFGKTTSKQK